MSAPPQSAVRSEIARALREAIDKRGFSSIAEAARDLGISRQRLHAHLEGKATPHVEILLLAMKKWGMRLRCLDVEFVCTAPEKMDSKRKPTPLQLHLFNEPTVLQNKIVQVRVRRKQANSLRLSMDIKLRA